MPNSTNPVIPLTRSLPRARRQEVLELIEESRSEDSLDLIEENNSDVRPIVTQKSTQDIMQEL